MSSRKGRKAKPGYTKRQLRRVVNRLHKDQENGQGELLQRATAAVTHKRSGPKVVDVRYTQLLESPRGGSALKDHLVAEVVSIDRVKHGTFYVARDDLGVMHWLRAEHGYPLKKHGEHACFDTKRPMKFGLYPGNLVIIPGCPSDPRYGTYALLSGLIAMGYQVFTKRVAVAAT